MGLSGIIVHQVLSLYSGDRDWFYRISEATHHLNSGALDEWRSGGYTACFHCSKIPDE
jgi:hypothetical protein